MRSSQNAAKLTSGDLRRSTGDQPGEHGSRWAETASNAEHFGCSGAPEKMPARRGNNYINARLLVLQQMGLAEPSGQGVWLVRRDFRNRLKAMQRSGDRQKMLASHGSSALG